MNNNWFEDYSRNVIKNSSINTVPDNIVKFGIVFIDSNGEKVYNNITTVEIPDEEYTTLINNRL